MPGPWPLTSTPFTVVNAAAAAVDVVVVFKDDSGDTTTVVDAAAAAVDVVVVVEENSVSTDTAVIDGSCS